MVEEEDIPIRQLTDGPAVGCLDATKREPEQEIR